VALCISLFCLVMASNYDQNYYLVSIKDESKVKEYVDLICRICGPAGMNVTLQKLAEPFKGHSYLEPSGASGDIMSAELPIDNDAIMGEFTKIKEQCADSKCDDMVIWYFGSSKVRRRYQLPLTTDEFWATVPDMTVKLTEKFISAQQDIERCIKRGSNLVMLFYNKVKFDADEMLPILKEINKKGQEESEKKYQIYALLHLQSSTLVDFVIGIKYGDRMSFQLMRMHKNGLCDLHAFPFDLDDGYMYEWPEYNHVFKEWKANGRKGPIFTSNVARLTPELEEALHKEKAEREREEALDREEAERERGEALDRQEAERERKEFLDKVEALDKNEEVCIADL
jgi:hypothetical protein